MSDDLEPLHPRDATQMYLDHRRNDVRKRTLNAHYYRLKLFREWCEEQGITNLNDLTGRDLHEYKVHRSVELDLAPTTVRGDLFTLKAFLEFCELMDAVPEGMHAKIQPMIPSNAGDVGVSDATIEEERVEEILNYLERFEYASLRHTMFAFAWHVGCRLGAIRGLDLTDVHLEGDEPYVEFHHRPDTDTPLKNGTDGERLVNVSTEIAQLLADYVEFKRKDATDEYGREPLFATTRGRVSRSKVRHAFYRLTRPCMYGPCPHDENPDTCDAMEMGKESTCPSARAPHAIRTGAITRLRRRDIPPEIISERVNATQEVIERHYDKTTAEERRRLRRNHLEAIL